jgi:3-oxoacyl-[acyl-carrier protein] reductase
MSWNNKNVVVVGGSSGIGLALIKSLSSEGAKVYNYSRNAHDSFADLGVIHQQFDVAQSEGMSALPEVIHALAYCPGTINLKPFGRFTANDFSHDFQVNALGAAKVVQECIKGLKAAAGASVVFFSTVAVQTGMSFHASIAMAKGAVEGLTRSLAAEFAVNHIRFNTIAPSLTDTPLAKNLLSTEEKKEASAKRHPLGKIGNSKELAELAKFLLSEQNAWMTGQIIGMDGGMSSIKNL